MGNRCRVSSRYTWAFRRLFGDPLGQPPQPTVLEHTYIPRALAHDRSNLADIEPTQYAEQNHLGLISRQARSNERDSGTGANHVDGQARRVIRGRTFAQDLRRYGDAPSARLTPSPVDETVPRDREHPCAELAVITMERSEVSSSCEPRVGLDVFCCRRIEASQEPQQSRMEIVPEDGDRPRRSVLRGRKYLVEFVGGHVSVCTQGRLLRFGRLPRSRQSSDEFGPGAPTHRVE